MGTANMVLRVDLCISEGMIGQRFYWSPFACVRG